MDEAVASFIREASGIRKKLNVTKIKMQFPHNPTPELPQKRGIDVTWLNGSRCSSEQALQHIWKVALVMTVGLLQSKVQSDWKKYAAKLFGVEVIFTRV